MAKGLTHLAKGLRKRSTDVEQLLWSRLRAGRFEGVKFRRQHPIGQYIADFVCLERKLIIETDSECIPRRLAAGLASEYREIIPYVKIPCCLCRRVLHLDGGQHAMPEEILKDRQRDAWLEKGGYTVIRFWDNEVLTNTSGVLEVIRERLHSTPSPQSPPLKGGDVIIHTK